MLLNELYTIQEKTQIENGLSVAIELNPEHFVYKAHFPGTPITPGVYLLQIAKEILAEHFNTSLTFTAAKNVKFLQILNPLQNPKATYKINWRIVDERYETSIIVEHEATVFVKISATFRVLA
jgi:3-hydroxyacyl-[acyl-carrier-protein] dehydratase